MPLQTSILFDDIVPESAQHMLLGRYLAQVLHLSGTLIRRLKVTGGIVVNGAVARTCDRLNAGDRLCLFWQGRESVTVTPEPLALDILYDDADFIVLNKPAGTVVHPTHGVYSQTLANGLAHFFFSRGEPVQIHPVHRLDRMTSGVIVFARHPLAHQRLSEQLLTCKWLKRYRALVRGRMESDSGRITLPIARVTHHPVKRCVRGDGQSADTTYRVLQRHAHITELDVTLHTGRTHQIRVHLAAIGHPLIQDDLYESERAGKPLRHALHASTLGFRHPRTGAHMIFCAPEPQDWKELVQTQTDDPITYHPSHEQ